MSEQNYRLTKAILLSIALLIAGAYVWSTRYVYDKEGEYIIDKWSHKLYYIEDGN